MDITRNHLGQWGCSLKPFSLSVFPEHDWKRPLGPAKTFLPLESCVSLGQVPLRSEGASWSSGWAGALERSVPPCPGGVRRRAVPLALSSQVRSRPNRQCWEDSEEQGSSRLLPSPRFLTRPPSSVVWFRGPRITEEDVPARGSAEGECGDASALAAHCVLET